MNKPVNNSTEKGEKPLFIQYIFVVTEESENSVWDNIILVIKNIEKAIRNF